MMLLSGLPHPHDVKGQKYAIACRHIHDPRLALDQWAEREGIKLDRRLSLENMQEELKCILAGVPFELPGADDTAEVVEAVTASWNGE